MEILRIENLEFAYPVIENNKNKDDSISKNVLNNVSFTVNEGEFVVIMGESGCGKTTLLKMIKKELMPKGNKKGLVLYKGADIEKLTDKESLEAIGYVMQNPDNQIVTDKVYHELAFGLEALGYDTDEMKRRIAEMISYFGITELYDKDTDKLSGGQKQMINLAAVMVTAPRILVLDEPTSQLDPIAASEFLSTIRKLNTELGLTVIMVEHRLEEVFSMADRIMLMENGRILTMDNPSVVGNYLMKHKLINAAPASVRLFSYMEDEGSNRQCPINIKEGRRYISENYMISDTNDKVDKIELTYDNSNDTQNNSCDTKDIIKMKEVYFRYDKKQKDVLKGLNLSIKEGEIFALLGGNGSGKTTALSVMAGLKRAYSGKIFIDDIEINKYKNNELYNKLSLLPQNPIHIFLEDSVLADYKAIITDKDKDKLIDEVATKLDILHLMHMHPYDLSGGELQKCAIGKLLLLKPKIMLLDEPTKGLDGYSKETLMNILLELKRQGITVLLVSHDIEFVATLADRCGLLFEGNVLSVSKPHKFFENNSFYTTCANRMCRDMIKGVITVEEIVKVLKHNG